MSTLFGRYIFREFASAKLRGRDTTISPLRIASVFIYNGITTRAHDYGNFHRDVRRYIKLTHRSVMSLFGAYTRRNEKKKKKTRKKGRKRTRPRIDVVARALRRVVEGA